MINQFPLIQTESFIVRYTKKIPKLYAIIFAVLMVALLFLVYNYLSISTGYKNKMKENKTISENNELLIKELQKTEDELQNVNAQISKNELLNNELQQNRYKLHQSKDTLSQAVSNYELRLAQLSVNEQKAEQIKLLKKKYDKYQKELDLIQTNIYSKATIAHSNVLKLNSNEKQLIEEWIGKKFGAACYLSDIDGFSTHMFYKRCSGKGPTVTLYQSYSHRFGGYTSTSWQMTGDPIYKNDPESLLFSLDNQKKYLPKSTEKIILNAEGYFPTFGPKDIFVSETTSEANFPDTYGDKIEDRKTKFFGSNGKFDLERIEVFIME